MMGAMSSARPALVLALATLGCGSEREPPPPSTIALAVTCDDVVTSFALGADQQLVTAPCGAPWTALQLDGTARGELVHAQPGRQVWLRRRGDHAVAEVITGGHVTASVDPLAELTWRTGAAPARPAEPTLAIEHAGTTTRLALHELKRRFRAPGAASGADLSLCAIADALGDHDAPIVVIGEPDETPQEFTRAQCRDRGLILHLSKKGELRLRSGSGERLVRIIRGVRL
jgi:hypothetical protein